MKCSILTTNNKNSSNIEKFIQKAEVIHGMKYDYSLVDYKNNRTKIKIICPEHGLFEQSPLAHITSRACPVCGRKQANKKMSSNTKEFIQKVKMIHGDKYNYSLVDYTNSKIKVEIICPEHGMFEQTPSSHKAGVGCPLCNASKGEKEVESFLNNFKVKFEMQKKFDGCRNKYCLPFDFYIPSKNICIEYDGEQHFRPIKFFGGVNKFKKQVENDKIKNEYCVDNDIRLIRIKYNESIKLKLKELICER